MAPELCEMQVKIEDKILATANNLAAAKLHNRDAYIGQRTALLESQRHFLYQHQQVEYGQKVIDTRQTGILRQSGMRITLPTCAILHRVPVNR